MLEQALDWQVDPQLSSVEHIVMTSGPGRLDHPQVEVDVKWSASLEPCAGARTAVDGVMATFPCQAGGVPDARERTGRGAGEGRLAGRRPGDGGSAMGLPELAPESVGRGDVVPAGQ
jgi:hypothetical protein